MSRTPGTIPSARRRARRCGAPRPVVVSRGGRRIKSRTHVSYCRGARPQRRGGSQTILREQRYSTGRRRTSVLRCGELAKARAVTKSGPREVKEQDEMANYIYDATGERGSSTS